MIIKGKQNKCYAIISKESKDRVRRSLSVGNVLIEQMKYKGKKKDKEVHKMLYGILAGTIVSKHRCVSETVKQQGLIDRG